MTLDQELGDGCEIVGNDAPADPTFHAYFATPALACGASVRQAAVQVAGASQLANAAFDPIAKTLSSAKPGLPLVVAALVGFIPGLGQADLLHSQSLRLLLVVGRVNAAIPTNFFGWFAEDLAVIAQAGEQQWRFIGVAFQDAVFAHQSAIHSPALACGASVGIPDLAPELGLFGFGFSAADQGGRGFKQAQHFFARGHRFPVQDSRLGLGDNLLDQRQIVTQLFMQSIRRRVMQLAQAGLDLGHLGQQGLHHRQQLFIQFQAGFCSRSCNCRNSGICCACCTSSFS
jgi:hypothetical protein